MWKVVGAIIDTRLRESVHLYNVLHGLKKGRGTGTAILDLKLAQELASLDREPLFLVFLYLQKSYYSGTDW